MNLTSRPSTRALAGRSLLAGISAGLRSMTPMGVLAGMRNHAPASAGWKDWPVLRSGFGRSMLQLAWAGELVGDKLPGVPPRTDPGSLAGRTILGALIGLAIGTEGKGAIPKGIGLATGMAGALAGSFGGYQARTYLTKNAGLPDVPIALGEDALAWAIARKATRG